MEQVVDRLEDRFLLLTGGCRNARPQQRTLRALIDWSYELCTPAERLLWNRLSVFAGSFSLDAVEGVCAGEGIDTHEVLDLLDRLVTQSLVEHAAGEGPPRYRLLETIRQYGCERLVGSGEGQRAQRRHRDFFLALAERLHQDWFGPRQAQILVRLRAEHGNLLAALEYRGGPQAPVMVPGTDGRPGLESGQAQHPASGSGDQQSALVLAAALVYHWVAGGFLGEGRRHLERALGQAPEPTEVRARALVAAAYMAQLQYDLTVADRWIQEAEELAERLGEPAVGAHARGHRGVSAPYRGRLDEALCDIEQAVAAHTARGDRFGEVTWRCALAIVQCLGGDPRAPQTGKQALAAAEDHGERWPRAHQTGGGTFSTWCALDTRLPPPSSATPPTSPPRTGATGKPVRAAIQVARLRQVITADPLTKICEPLVVSELTSTRG
ncbi:ATP-binding protein [Streptomyces sp. NY05-11A]|uniref:ATP-binding protein n=1 Tax=Streptomyces soliscabiei TaxID=588897 RepID=UPI003B999E9F